MLATITLFLTALVVGAANSAVVPSFAVPPVCGTMSISSLALEDALHNAGCIFFGEPCRKSVSVTIEEISDEVKTAAQRVMNLYGGSVCYDMQGEVQSYQITDSSCQCEFFSFQNCNARVSVLTVATSEATHVSLEGAKSYFCQKF